MNKLNFETMPATKKSFIDEVKAARTASKKDRQQARKKARQSKIFLNSL